MSTGKARVFSNTDIEDITNELWKNVNTDNPENPQVPAILEGGFKGLIASIVDAYNSKRTPYTAIAKAKKVFVEAVSLGRHMGKQEAELVVDEVADYIQGRTRGR